MKYIEGYPVIIRNRYSILKSLNILEYVDFEKRKSYEYVNSKKHYIKMLKEHKTLIREIESAVFFTKIALKRRLNKKFYELHQIRGSEFIGHCVGGYDRTQENINLAYLQWRVCGKIWNDRKGEWAEPSLIMAIKIRLNSKIIAKVTTY